MSAPRILLLPGLGNSDADHWQSRWEQAFPNFSRGDQDEWQTPAAAPWVARLNNVIQVSRRPAILVAHSLACALVVRWALAHSGPIVAALLVAPTDIDGPGSPAGPTGFVPMPLRRLPFRSVVVASTDDPYLSVARGRQFAEVWGAEYVLLGARGHIGSAANLGHWEEGLAILDRLRNKVVRTNSSDLSD